MCKAIEAHRDVAAAALCFVADNHAMKEPFSTGNRWEGFSNHDDAAGLAIVDDVRSGSGVEQPRREQAVRLARRYAEQVVRTVYRDAGNSKTRLRRGFDELFRGCRGGHRLRMDPDDEDGLEAAVAEAEGEEVDEAEGLSDRDDSSEPEHTPPTIAAKRAAVQSARDAYEAAKATTEALKAKLDKRESELSKAEAAIRAATERAAAAAAAARGRRRVAKAGRAHRMSDDEASGSERDDDLGGFIVPDEEEEEEDDEEADASPSPSDEDGSEEDDSASEDGTSVSEDAPRAARQPTPVTPALRKAARPARRGLKFEDSSSDDDCADAPPAVDVARPLKRLRRLSSEQAA